MPVHPLTGQVMQVRIERIDAEAGTVAWRDPADGAWFETPVTRGGAKLQWKADWAMRWHALGVDYEMSGKDLIDSVRLSGRICRILGSAPPVGFTYELFLDEQAQKISKSKGNGLSVDEWLRYAPAESLAQFMFNQPQRAKRLYFDVIPRAVDEYLANAERIHAQPEAERAANPAWHIHSGQVPQSAASPLSFAMLLNLASVVNADSPDLLWGFIRRYNPQATPRDMPFLAQLVDHAVAYYRDFVRPAKTFRQPDAVERAALSDLAAALAALPADSSAEDIQTVLYDVGKRHPFPELRAWFGCLYQVLLGQAEGPRFGQFVALYGITETIALIEAALARPADAA
jgi:lysyl-tRNA synthetase class 1